MSFVVIFLAELGDKSQLMALTFASRYRPLPILVGITLSTALVHAVSVGAGAMLGLAMPTTAITVIAGLAFFAFAIWTVRGDSLTTGERIKPERRAVR